MTLTQTAATLFFAFAILHSFLVKRFIHIASKFKKGSIRENFFHLLGEVEIVFGFWAGLFLLVYIFLEDQEQTINYINSLNFREPLFIFVIMAMSATAPIIECLKFSIVAISKLIPANKELSFYVTALLLGPLLGSFVTEPAAMTVTALLLKESFFDQSYSKPFKYFTLAILFVNISIGGTLTHFAAPPVIMVANSWGWDMSHMYSHFGWKALVATLINTLSAIIVFGHQFGKVKVSAKKSKPLATPPWMIMAHLFFIAAVVYTAHHVTVFIGLFLFFLGFMNVTKKFQEELKLRESMLVSFFLIGLVILGGQQGWWLQPLLTSLNDTSMFLGATFLTAITDNAALTYLGSQVEGLADTLKFSLVAGAVAGGGLTVIANAPNPIGYSILKESFEEESISPMGLFVAALAPTLVAMICFWYLPNLL